MKNKYDLIKALTILLVVLGHTTNHYSALSTKVVTVAINLFHMSLFVAVSGAVFKMGCDRGKYGEFVPFMMTKAKRLLIPFAFTAMVVLAPTLIACGMTGLGYVGTVANIFGGGVFVKHLWYLQALFWIFIAAWIIVKSKVNLYVAFFAAVALATGCSLFDANRYLSLGMAISYLPMFVLGMILLRITKNSGWRQVMAWLVGCVLFGLAQIVVKDPLIDYIIRIFFSGSIVGLCVTLADYLYVHVKDSRILAFLAKQSFGIYLFHMTPIYFIRHWGCDSWPLWLAVIATFAFSLVGSIVLTHIVRVCHLQVLIGEK